MNQPPWQQGGGVNAIEKSVPVLQALRELSAEWAARDRKAHPLLGRPCVQPTIVRGGAFISNVPESCEIDLNATYLPGGRGRARLRQRPARRDPERRRGRAARRRLVRRAPARVDLGDRLPAVGDRPRRGHHHRHARGVGRAGRRRARRGHRHDLRRRAAHAARGRPRARPSGPATSAARTPRTSGSASTSSCSARAPTRARSVAWCGVA